MSRKKVDVKALVEEMSAGGRPPDPTARPQDDPQFTSEDGVPPDEGAEAVESSPEDTAEDAGDVEEAHHGGGNLVGMRRSQQIGQTRGGIPYTREKS